MILFPHTTVGEAASQFPATIRVFQRLRVEFCCDGRRTLDDLCRERQLSFEDLAAALAAARAAPAPARHDWSARPLSDLTAHIVESFHEPLRQELPRLRRLAVKVQRHTDPYRHVLAVVLNELERFTAELVPHMASEELEFFPLVCRMETGQPHEGDAARFRQLRTTFGAEHADAGRALQILGRVTGCYEAPPRACATLRDLYRGLTELEQLMQLHIHLENNVLFPRAAALVSEAGIERS